MISCKDMIAQIEQLNAVTRLDIRLIDLLSQMQSYPKLSDSAKLVLYLYFSMLDDGNTRIPLDAEKLSRTWLRKWESLCMLKDNSPDIEPLDEKNLIALIQPGIESLLLKEDGCSNIICASESRDNYIESLLKKNEEHGAASEFGSTYADAKPMVVDEDSYLYAVRYYDAKCMIEKQFEDVFKLSAEQSVHDDLSALESVLNKGAPKLAVEQREAILRGLRGNLIITGGPGTGKTTVICYLLWMLLNELSDFEHWSICLAAPSGKASDRMRESIIDCLKNFDEDRMSENQKKIYKKLQGQESMTLHRLLKYNPANNRFTYNAENHFPDYTIFVIDEASMIDIDLFAKFMSALPKDESKYRVYILGDPYQLPSVDAGAVLGEVLESAPNLKVELTLSHRFDSDTDVGKLAGWIKECAKNPNDSVKFYDRFVEIPKNIPLDCGNCQYYALTMGDDQTASSWKARKEQFQKKERTLNSLIKQWCDAFYTDLTGAASKIDPNKPINEQLDNINVLWRIVESARILSAEKNGLTGTVTLNALVRKHLFERLGKDHPDIKSHFFTGQILMLTRNQEMLKLYNGDTGIVIGEKDTGRKYLLLQKSSQSKDNENEYRKESRVPYTIYPLSLLPEDALESGFAMTIHKAQGSGYDNIMMFLPEKAGHPLLNNQIVYTGVTRTKIRKEKEGSQMLKGSLTMISNQDAFEYACRTVVRRDTGIHIG